MKAGDKAAYAKWVKSHQPFHWFVEFYGIVSNGGFDVIIGNPPYVEYAKVKDSIQLRSYETASSRQFIRAMSRSVAFEFWSIYRRFGLIVPIIIVSTTGLNLYKNYVWPNRCRSLAANFDRPSGKTISKASKDSPHNLHR